ncbi:MAG: membrane dipeptidase [Acidobacteria bacterium]|nr:membrane dipeptidase [Acidobacteriota bacterium]
MPLTRRQWVLAAAAWSAACSSPAPEPETAVETPPEADFLKNVHVIDLHCDTPMRIAAEGFDLGKRNDYGQVDIPRLHEGGYTGVFFSVYCPGARGATPEKFQEALDIMAKIEAEVGRHPGDLFLGDSAGDIERAKQEGKITILYGIEGGHMIDSKLDNLRTLFSKGGRYMTLTHSKHTPWAGSSGDTAADDPGLTELGREIVAEMNRLGMMVDVSHISDKTFAAVRETSAAPLIASHSSCRALSSAPRNMTDGMLKQVADTGGVVHINYYDGFLDDGFRARSAAWGEDHKGEAEKLKAEYAGDPQGLAHALYRRQIAKLDEIGRPPLAVLLDHFEHAVTVMGVEGVGLGSDFDGVDEELPEGMEDCSKTMNLVEGLRGRGLSDGDISKILGENTLRVMRDVQAAAKPDA